jgi:hypothetical protein
MFRTLEMKGKIHLERFFLNHVQFFPVFTYFCYPLAETAAIADWLNPFIISQNARTIS